MLVNFSYYEDYIEHIPSFVSSINGYGGVSYYDGDDIDIIKKCNASCIFTKLNIDVEDKILIIHESPRFAFSKFVYKYRKSLVQPFSHKLTKDNNCIYNNVSVGYNTNIRYGCVIGDAGFGFSEYNGEIIPMPHFGGVTIGNNVEIGPNSVIDCGTFGNTIIGNNVFIDNMCQIAHNVVIGDNTKIMARVSISGAVDIGKNCWIAPGVVIKEKIKIGDNSLIGIGSIVTKDVPPNMIYKPAYKTMHVVIPKEASYGI